MPVNPKTGMIDGCDELRRDKRKRLARIAEYRKSMEPITPEQAKNLRDGDEFFYLQAGGGAPRYHVTLDKLDRRPDITKWKCFTEGRAYWTREAAVAALAKQTPVEFHEKPIGETQAKEVVTDETQDAEETQPKISYDDAMRYARQNHRLRQVGVPECYRIPFGCCDILDITMELEHPIATAIEHLYRCRNKTSDEKARDVHKAINILERWLDAGTLKTPCPF